MENLGTIEIHIVGSKGTSALTPENYDIREVMSILEGVEDLLYPNYKGSRPLISYSLQSGSVRNVFKTSMQAVVSFAAVAQMIAQTGSIDGLEIKTAQAIEKIQENSRKTSYTFEFKTSLAEETTFTISPTTNYKRTANLWVDAEFYFYGLITNAGGKDKSNIHLDTRDMGLLKIAADKEYLKQEERNLLYKEYGVRVRGKQNVESGEIDKGDLQLVELIDYLPLYDDAYLNSLIDKVGDRFAGVDVDKMISEIRGNYES